MKIANENNKTIGVYCGYHGYQQVIVTGDHAVITFRSDYSVQERGFLFLFTTIPISKYSLQQCCCCTHSTVMTDVGWGGVVVQKREYFF